MESKPIDRTDRLARVVHWTLLAGLIVSGLLFVVGLATVLIKNQPRPVDVPKPIATLFQSALAGDGVALLNLALLVLMLTPLARVLILALGWSAQHNWRFAAVAFIVLSLLSVSLLIGTR